MKKSRVTEEQIIRILKEGEVGQGYKNIKSIFYGYQKSFDLFVRFYLTPFGTKLD